MPATAADLAMLAGLAAVAGLGLWQGLAMRRLLRARKRDRRALAALAGRLEARGGELAWRLEVIEAALRDLAEARRHQPAAAPPAPAAPVVTLARHLARSGATPFSRDASQP